MCCRPVQRLPQLPLQPRQLQVAQQVAQLGALQEEQVEVLLAVPGPGVVLALAVVLPVAVQGLVAVLVQVVAQQAAVANQPISTSPSPSVDLCEGQCAALTQSVEGP